MHKHTTFHNNIYKIYIKALLLSILINGCIIACTVIIGNKNKVNTEPDVDLRQRSELNADKYELIDSDTLQSDY